MDKVNSESPALPEVNGVPDDPVPMDTADSPDEAGPSTSAADHGVGFEAVLLPKELLLFWTGLFVTPSPALCPCSVRCLFDCSQTGNCSQSTPQRRFWYSVRLEMSL